MSKITFQQYLNSFSSYNNVLSQYRESLYNKQQDNVNERYKELVEKYNILKTELNGILENSFTHTESERSTLIYEHGRILHEQNTLRINHNNTFSESDLISLTQRKQEKAIEDQLQSVHNQVYALFDVIRPGSSAQYDITIPVSEYNHDLNAEELNTQVLDSHAFYRIIRKKEAANEYSNSQYEKLYFNISENLSKKPITVADIIKYYKDNSITQLTDDEFRSLIKSENKDYKNTENSVRETGGNDYIKGELTVSYTENTDNDFTDKDAVEYLIKYGYLNKDDTFQIKDADSFYKLISNKMTLGEYSALQFRELYINISEKLVYSALTKGEINQFYAEQNIKPLTNNEWDTLIARQETRRVTDNIAEKSGNLKFQGTVHINTEENFKLNIDVYHNGQTANGMPAEGFNVKDIADILLKTTQSFNKAFGIRKLDDATDFRVFIFNSREDYLKYNPEPRGHATPSDNGNVASIYLFQGKNNYQDPADLLRHEFVHALTFQATSKLPIARTFMEGMAEYIVHKMQGDSSTDFFELIPAENLNRSIQEIMQTPSENDHYQTGAAIVAFLEETQPNFLENLLFAARDARQSDKQIALQEMMQSLFEKENKPLRDITWFKEKMTDNPPGDQIPQHTHHSQEHAHHSQGAQGKPGNTAEYESRAQKHVDTAQHNDNVDIIDIDYFDIEKLYQSVAESEKKSVLTLWNKLHAAQYKVNPIKDSLDAEELSYINQLQHQDDADEPEEQLININIFA